MLLSWPLVAAPREDNLVDDIVALLDQEAAEEAEQQRVAGDAALVTAELGLDGSVPLANLVAAANTAMGLEGEGPLAAQLQTLLTELGFSAEPDAA